MFTSDQLAQLEGKLDAANVKGRKGANGANVSYLEAWQVIDVANAVFGFGNWDAETVSMMREHEPVQIPPSPEYPKGGVVVAYSARVRVTVHSHDGSRKVVRERSGGHRGFGPTVGQAVEDCIKAAESDATKRAFVTFGNIFGLALYDKQQRGVTQESERQQVTGSGRRSLPIDEGFQDQGQPKISERAKSTAPANGHGGNGRMSY
jgi:recombination DNA repair RAD52 pathway protein